MMIRTKLVVPSIEPVFNYRTVLRSSGLQRWSEKQLGSLG